MPGSKPGALPLGDSPIDCKQQSDRERYFVGLPHHCQAIVFLSRKAALEKHRPVDFTNGKITRDPLQKEGHSTGFPRPRE